MSEDVEAIRSLHALADLVTPMALRVFVSLGVPDAIDERPGTAPELACRCGCDARILRSVLDHLAARGVVTKEPDDTYGLTTLGRLTCDTDGPSLQSWLVGSLRLGTLRGDVDHSVVALLDVARSGRTALEEQHGESVWERVTRMDAGAAIQEFGRLVPVLDIEPIWRLLEAYPAATVCDVGAGSGRLAHELLSGELCSFCHVVDLAPMVGVADTVLGHRFATRYAAVAADFMTDPLPEADLYIVSDVLVDWDDARAVRLLRNVHGACRPDARVLISELTLPSGAGDLFDPTAGRLRLNIEMPSPNRTVEALVTLGRAAGLAEVSTACGEHRSAILFAPA
ncbi:hypothetical protein FRP1_30105 (plasmid) [Pseudonocardia sp. EC080625-04]|uniref:methyltransferase n=1 Tax=unclassified Pseudonocardia TaxID=2619320 RepID=UPI0006CB3D3F|nr:MULTISPECIES: methyltransferase [unclassified Pseudonocardia]ALE76979.1 hypothetical protein FRP1_30105 [Pseudonocardia sp. EC080625-04]ALL85921.1 hypothetical protein AD017_33050 [Pseudonocardia sp. EC080619-01]